MGERKIHWVSRETFGLPKQDRGMGFRNLKKFNLAFLAKQCWHLIHYPDSFWAQAIKHRYFLDCYFFEAKKGEGFVGVG